MPRTDRRRKHLRVPVTGDEAERITCYAAACGLPVAAYLRQRGLGFEPQSMLDAERVDALTRAMGDLGRLGGLLKLWLTDDAKLRAYPAYQVRDLIPDALQKIRKSQGALLEIIEQLRKPAALPVEQGKDTE